MFSPAGHAWLQGGRRCTYSGRSSRQEPVLFARLEPTSSVIANGLSLRKPAPRLDAGDDIGPRLGLEQVGKARLWAQVLLDGHLTADLRDLGHLAVAGL